MKYIIYQIIAVFFIAICSLGCRPGSKESGPRVSDSYLFQDVIQDELHPATIAELTFPSSGSSIYGFEYIANGIGPHPTVILVHANPGNERNLDVAQSLRRAGYNVFFFNYRGSWGSEGEYTYANCIADTKAVIDFAIDSNNAKNLRVDTSKIFLIGHNLGAGIALLEGLQDPRVKGVAAISLVNPYTTFRSNQGKFNFQDLEIYLSSLGMLNIKPREFLMSIVNNLDNYNVEKMLSTTKKPVMILDEHHNNENLTKYISQRLIYEIWETDLEFTDKRIGLTKKLKLWLDKQVNSGK